MQAVADNLVMLAMFEFGSWEIVLILAIVLILVATRKISDLARGLGRGLFHFRSAIDEVASDAGRSLGGIYGKSTFQALTPNNQVAELYDPKGVRKNWRRAKRWKLLKRRLVQPWRGLLSKLGFPAEKPSTLHGG